jgi:hypothetical protein
MMPTNLVSQRPSALDRIAVAVVRSRIWNAFFWLAGPLHHIALLRNWDALGADPPVTWRHLLLLRDPRGKFTGESHEAEASLDA